MWRKKQLTSFRQTKYGSRRTSCGEHSHRSKLEAKVCGELALRLKCGDIKGYRCEVDIPLIVNGVKITTYRCDFWVENNDGTDEIVEAKGFPNPVGMFKWHLCVAIFKGERPNTTMTMVTR